MRRCFMKNFKVAGKVRFKSRDINQTLNTNFYLITFPAFNYIYETRTRPTPNTDTFHAVDVRTLLRYFNTIVL